MDCVGVRTGLPSDAAATPGWKEVTADIGGEERRLEGRRER